MAHYQDQKDVVEGVLELEKVKHELCTVNAVKRRGKEQTSFSRMNCLKMNDATDLWHVSEIGVSFAVTGFRGEA
jgi:hypothetical protein